MDSTTPLGLSDEQLLDVVIGQGHVDRLNDCDSHEETKHYALRLGKAVIAAHEQAQAKAQGAASVEASVASGWLPIDTAPRDGRWLLVWGPRARTKATCMVVAWDENCWTSADDGYAAYMNPTHWMTLPPAPTAPQSKPEQPTESGDVLDAQRWRMASTSRQHGITDWHQFGQRTVYGALAEQLIDAAIRAAKTGG